jgi:large subunit ribosomal protein L24
MAKIKKGDQVIVIAGKEKGKQGTVLSVSNDRVMVEGLNLVKKHQKPNRATGAEGAVVTQEASLHISNVAIFNATTQKADRGNAWNFIIASKRSSSLAFTFAITAFNSARFAAYLATVASRFNSRLIILFLAISTSYLNGKPNARISARPSSSVRAVVVMVISIPRIRSILSKSISGNMICSLRPIE